MDKVTCKKFIADSIEKFKNKVKEDKDRIELINRFQKELWYYYGLFFESKDDKYLEQLLNYSTSILSSKIEVVKSELLDDEAFEDILLVDDMIDTMCINKINNNDLSSDVLLDDIEERVADDLIKVKDFNAKESKEYVDLIRKNIFFLETNNIESATDRIKAYYNMIKKLESKKSHR